LLNPRLKYVIFVFGFLKCLILEKTEKPELYKPICYIALALVIASIPAMAQEFDPIPIRLKGRVVNMANNEPVPYSQVVNIRSHGGTISNADGYFTMDMLNIDSLMISSVGYMKEIFVSPGYNFADTVVVFRLRPVSILLQQVDVKGDAAKVNMTGVPVGKPVDIDPKLRGDAFNQRPPIIAAFFNPVSYWYYYLNKKEKQKREVRNAMLLEKNWELHSQNYNKQMVKMLTGLNDNQADEFMVWFNSLDVLPYTSTEYEVRSTIRQYFEVYKSEGRVK
jgi:hypothetical protein